MNPCAHATAFVAALAVVACQPELPIPEGAGEGGAAGAAPFTIAVEPDAALDAVPSVVQLRVDAPPLGAMAERIVFAEGELGPGHLREFAVGDVSNALSERLLEALTWADAEGALHVAPTAALVAGEMYSVALGDVSLSATVTVSAEPPPMLPRVWPPPAHAASMTLGVWCGAEPLDMATTPMRLEPGGPAGALERGVDGVDARCVSFRAKGTGTGMGTGTGKAVALAAVPGTDPPIGLDPRPFSVDVEGELLPQPACEEGEVPFGPGCVRVEDDRLLGRGPAVPVLWAVSGSGLDSVFTTNPGDPFVLTSLPAAHEVSLSVGAFDTAGRPAITSFHATMRAPMAHVVLSEVTANPIGPEPAQEWVEIVNDGIIAADLTGYVLVDLGGETPLPPAVLPAGGYALLVGEDYIDGDGWDTPAVAGTLLLRVPRVGKSGLSNEGEPLLLRAPDSSVVSSFPAAPKPKSGLSVGRLTPSSPDGLAASFVLATPTPGSANQPAP